MRNVHQEIKSTLLWIALATVVGLVGIWQAKVAIGQGLHPVQESLPPPLKTRVAVRPPPEVFTGDVVEDYIARCNKGLSDQEIGWIVTDFRNAGLDDPPADNSPDNILIDYHKRQNRWYCDAIIDGLRLSSSQSAEAAQNLAELLQEVSDAFLHGIASEKYKEFTPKELQSLFHNWIFSSNESGERVRIPPRTLFTPTAHQQDILDHSFGAGGSEADPFDSAPAASPASPVTQAPPIDPSQPTLKGKTAATYPIEEDYPIPAGFEEADQTFPILKSQQMVGVGKNEPAVSDPFIHNVRHLHPAQLKVLLLFKPQMAAEIQAALDKVSD